MEALVLTSLHELAALPVSVREGKVKALSEKSPACFTYCTSMRPSGLRSTWACLLVPPIVTLSEAKGLSRIGRVMLRGVYTERSECAQHDNAATHPNAWINVFFSICGPYGWSDSFVNVHYNRGNTLVANARSPSISSRSNHCKTSSSAPTLP
jgi:hypothetical protein